MQHNTTRYRFRKASLRGFTLLEMLVVLVIIGMLVGLVGPQLYSNVDRSKVQTAVTQAKLLKGAIETMRLDINTYPSVAQGGLRLLVERPSDEKLARKWRGPYLEDALPDDPWGNPYVYLIPGKNGKPFSILSYGADGKEGGEGYDADVGTIETKTDEPA
ncbi:type II secretion system major pseudopilin GspG [Chitinimonas sp. BJYL2]|uniref:type II secretion system major pseudopilin GspG n=1 Tax=Chitinimonas sp. BJYL2 TaxID=2976696 RepID=UPI0022B3F90E|nr:type II secretion system major pseudopilin GspG [Chitinimonas sp. BJYL2]